MTKIWPKYYKEVILKVNIFFFIIKKWTTAGWWWFSCLIFGWTSSSSRPPPITFRCWSGQGTAFLLLSLSFLPRHLPLKGGEGVPLLGLGGPLHHHPPPHSFLSIYFCCSWHLHSFSSYHHLLHLHLCFLSPHLVSFCWYLVFFLPEILWIW